MNTDLLMTLQNYWFSEKEAKIYLTTLELGSSIASTIARRSEVNRVTAYTILNDFKKRGIANEVTKSEVKYFSVISAELLMKQLEQKYESFKSKLPDFLAVEDKFWNRPKVQFFEWLEWIKKMYNDLLTYKEEPIRSFLWRNEMDEWLIAYFDKQFIPYRVKKRISARVILSEHEWDKWYSEINKDNLIETIHISENQFEIFNEINIYGWNKISMAIYSKNKSMSWMLIYSEELHKTFVSIFDLIRNAYKWKKR